MPLLALEPAVFPAELFSAGEAGLSPGRWWVLHTCPRAEKALAQKLLRRQIGFFLPLYERRWRNRGRLFCSHLPVFPGYVFLRGDRDQRLAALETKLVVRVLEVEDQRQLQEDLERVNRLIVSKVPLAPEERLATGTWVVVTSGSLEGMKGRVLSHGKQLRLVIEVQFLQRGVSVEIESWQVQPLKHQPSERCGRD
ncbi:MAG TPA: transcription termination/antitermination NusG family protein [Gemmataceae bacterium]|nr:transcription termination/antitermination NusG family protein [Gemmataceae bacterium]